LLAKRITQAVKERTDLQISCGTASFPEETLTFDDLLQTARERLLRSNYATDEQVVAFNANYN